MKAQNLMKELPKIAAQVMHNTRCVPANLKFKFELLAEAYGAAQLLDDFRLWCQEQVEKEAQFKHPILEYIKVVDTRLGSAPEEKRPDLKDPHIGELASMSYEMTDFLPAKTAVAETLLAFTFEEVRDALTEYADRLTEKEMKGAMRAFWSEGGAGAVILARRRRAQRVR